MSESHLARIREGTIVPWVGSGIEGCLRSAQVAKDELVTLASDDPRREFVAAQAEAWLDRADTLIAELRRSVTERDS